MVSRCCVALVLLHFFIAYFDARIKISFHRPWSSSSICVSGLPLRHVYLNCWHSRWTVFMNWVWVYVGQNKGKGLMGCVHEGMNYFLYLRYIWFVNTFLLLEIIRGKKHRVDLLVLGSNRGLCGLDWHQSHRQWSIYQVIFKSPIYSYAVC